MSDPAPLSEAAGDHALARSTQVMAIGTVLSRLTGFGRLFALAYAFGFTRLTDGYNLANTTPNIVYELALGGVLSGTLIPELAGRVADADAGHDDGRRATSAVVTAALAVMLGLSLLLFLAAPLVVRLYTIGNDAPGLDDQRAVATTLLRWFAPQIACLGVITLTTALLNVRRRFAAPMFAPVLANVVMIAVILATPSIAREVSLAALREDRRALLFLGLGTTAAYAVQAAAQWAALRGARLGLHIRWDLANPAVRRIVRLSGWTVGFTLANQLALWVVLVLANREAGAVSAYQAGLVFFQLPHAVITVSVMTAVLPELADRWRAGDRAGFARHVDWGLRTASTVVVPAAVGYALLALPLVTLVLKHGALSAGGARAAAEVLALLALGLPGYSAFLLLMRCWFAMQDTRTVFWLYALENGLNVALAVALFPAMGVRGLALAYALAYTFGAATAAVLLRRRLGVPVASQARATVARVIAASVVMAVAVRLVDVVAGRGGDLSLVARVGLGVGAGVSVYLLAAAVLGIDELRHLLRLRRRPA